jgi:transcription antitermination factor NusG
LHSTTDSRWFAAYVKPRHEANVSSHLAARGVEAFFPQYKSRRQWSDRTIDLLLPLFAGYIFVRIPIHERMRVLEVPGVFYLVGSVRPEPLLDSEIEQLKLGLNPRNNPQPHKHIRMGDRVVVTSGRLEGYEGFLLREKSQHRVVLCLDLIQRAMSVEVDADAIAPVNARACRTPGLSSMVLSRRH